MISLYKRCACPLDSSKAKVLNAKEGGSSIIYFSRLFLLTNLFRGFPLHSKHWCSPSINSSYCSSLSVLPTALPYQFFLLLPSSVVLTAALYQCFSLILCINFSYYCTCHLLSLLLSVSSYFFSHQFFLPFLPMFFTSVLLLSSFEI